MPWTDADAERHTKNAKTAQQKKIWATVANEVLKKSGDEGKAIRIANSAVNKDLAGASDGSGGPKPKPADKKGTT